MALEDSDLERIEHRIEIMFLKAIQPIRKDVELHDTVLLGVDRKNGLKKAVEDHTEDIADLKNFKKTLVWATTAIAGGISTGAPLLLKSILK